MEERKCPIGRQADIFDLIRDYKRPKKLLIEVFDEKPPAENTSPYRAVLSSGFVLRRRP